MQAISVRTVLGGVHVSKEAPPAQDLTKVPTPRRMTWTEEVFEKVGFMSSQVHVGIAFLREGSLSVKWEYLTTCPPYATVSHENA